MDKFTTHQIRFHLDKVGHLNREWERRKQAGEKRILKMEQELTQELNRLAEQINSHKDKIELLKAQSNGRV